MSVTKGKLFVSYENWLRGSHMFLSQVYVFISHTTSKGISMDGTVYKWSKVSRKIATSTVGK